jgi:hypothetical protein
MEIRNTRDLINPETFKFKCLCYAIPGTGKTDWAWDLALNPAGLAMESGEGKGMLTVADRSIDYVEPESLTDYETFCKGHYFREAGCLVVDGGSEIVRTVIQQFALTLPNPRAAGEQSRRTAGIPVGNDYQSMAEKMRTNLRSLLALDKHIIVTALERVDKPDRDNDPPGTPTYIGPDLPGQLMLGCTAMFDFVFRMRVRPALRDKNDPKSRYLQRYLMTENTGETVAKCRSVLSGKPLLPNEIIYSEDRKSGSPSDILRMLKEKYAEELTRQKCATPIEVLK